jgi:hypothetical protein
MIAGCRSDLEYTGGHLRKYVDAFADGGGNICSDGLVTGTGNHAYLLAINAYLVFRIDFNVERFAIYFYGVDARFRRSGGCGACFFYGFILANTEFGIALQKANAFFFAGCRDENVFVSFFDALGLKNFSCSLNAFIGIEVVAIDGGFGVQRLV